MKITVYVPCHNNESTVAQTLASLRGQSRPADQFLFIDDRCTDTSPQIAREHDFQILQMPGKQGLAAGRNCALANAQGDIIAGFDGDVVATESYLRELEKRFETMQQIAAICGRMDERFTDTPADLWRSVHMAQHLGSEEQFDPRILFGAVTAGRVGILRQLGGWDERYVTAFEDVDITQRLKGAGHRLLYAPSCRAWHLRRDTDESVLRTHWNYGYYGYEHTFSDIQSWLSGRLPYIWRRYQIFRVQDLHHPSLSSLTLRTSWAWVIRDLNVLRKIAPEVGHVPDVVKVADAVFSMYGADAQCGRKVLDWLSELAASLEDPAAPKLPLNQQIVNHVYTAALQSIPDGRYWRSLR